MNSYLMYLVLNDFIYFDDYHDGTKTKPEVLEDGLFKGNLPWEGINHSIANQSHYT